MTIFLKKVFIAFGAVILGFIVFDAFLYQDMYLTLRELLIFMASALFARGYTRFSDRQYYEKKYEVEGDYKNINKSIKGLRDILRRVVYEFKVNKKEKDFLLDIKVRGDVVMQVLHRVHFPEIYDKPIEDISFGMIVYIPYGHLPENEAQELLNFLKKEDPLWKQTSYPDYYILIDIGSRVRVGGYLITEILKKIFHLLDERELSYELFDEGELPYPVYKKS